MGKRAALLAAAGRGEVPAPPNFSALPIRDSGLSWPRLSRWPRRATSRGLGRGATPGSCLRARRRLSVIGRWRSRLLRRGNKPRCPPAGMRRPSGPPFLSWTPWHTTQCA
jgi:hypothetical protein